MAYVARSAGDPDKFYEIVIVTTTPWPASEAEYDERHNRALDILSEAIQIASGNNALPAEYAGWGRDIHPHAEGPVFVTKEAAHTFGNGVAPARQEDEVTYKAHLGGYSTELQEQFDRSEESL